MSKRISVVVPTRNRADLLATALDCMLSQSYPVDEIIVVDDGSTDSTTDLLRTYADRPVRHIRVDHGGHLRARNIGLREAAGDLVAYCDSDDLWRPTYIETVHRLWQRAPDLTASYANFAIVRDGAWSRESKFEAAPTGFWDGLSWIDRDLARVDRSWAGPLIDFQPFFPSGMVVDRRRFLALGGWDETVGAVVGSDFATALRIVAHPPVGIIQQPLVGIRKHRGNLSGDVERMNLGNARVLEHVLATRPELAGHARKIAASVATRRQDALAAAFVRQDMTEVRRIYSLLPSAARSPVVRVKAALAALPPSVATRVNALALRLGTSKASLASRRWAAGAAPRIDGGLSHGGLASLTSP